MGSLFSKRDTMDSTELVKKMISEHRIMVFSKSFCPFCKKAKSALDSVLQDSSKYTVMELDSRDDGPAIQDALAAMTGGRSVPRVFIDAEFIGGGDETAALAASGKLEEMVKAKAII